MNKFDAVSIIVSALFIYLIALVLIGACGKIPETITIKHEGKVTVEAQLKHCERALREIGPASEGVE